MTQYRYEVGIFLCYAVVAATCAGCAVADLLGRFKSGNRVSSILWGRSQFFFYLINIGAGFLALAGSEALEKTDILLKSSTNLPLALLQASGIALAAFFGLRTTVSMLLSSEPGQKLEIGPGQLFAVLLENVERRIDQDRTVTATEEIKGISETLSPRAVLNVVLPYCFDQAEKDPGDRPKITAALEAIVENSDRNIFSSERSALMLSHLHKVFGLSVLQSAAKLVSRNDGAGASAPVQNPNVGVSTLDVASNVLDAQGSELDGLLKKLISGTK